MQANPEDKIQKDAEGSPVKCGLLLDHLVKILAEVYLENNYRYKEGEKLNRV
jgi:hypothetical protein